MPSCVVILERNCQYEEWNEKKALDWYLLSESENKNLQEFVAKLNKLYCSHKCMYETDFDSRGFRWINADDAENSVYSWVRISEDKKKNLLFVLNFTPVERDNFRIGVPAKGKYKLVLGSDEDNQKKSLASNDGECDGFKQSLLVDLPRYGVAVYEFSADEIDEKKGL